MPLVSTLLNCDSFHCLLKREETIHGLFCNAMGHSREHSVSRPAESPYFYRVQLHMGGRVFVSGGGGGGLIKKQTNANQRFRFRGR